MGKGEMEKGEQGRHREWEGKRGESRGAEKGFNSSYFPCKMNKHSGKISNEIKGEKGEKNTRSILILTTHAREKKPAPSVSMHGR